jgi:hypothetical protein
VNAKWTKPLNEQIFPFIHSPKIYPVMELS